MIGQLVYTSQWLNVSVAKDETFGLRRLRPFQDHEQNVYSVSTDNQLLLPVNT